MSADTASLEQLRWHSAERLPDVDLTVLMWVTCASVADWAAGWWDGEAWRDCSHGGEVAGTVTHWAAPEGPAC